MMKTVAYLCTFICLKEPSSTKGTLIKFIFKIYYCSRLSGPLTASKLKWGQDNTLRTFKLFFHAIFHLSIFMQ